MTGATAADDYRNVFNTFGWVVEIDPFTRPPPRRIRPWAVLPTKAAGRATQWRQTCRLLHGRRFP